jgi:hypothetical protein
MIFFTDLKEAIIDIKNYIQLFYIINKNKRTSKWKDLNLRVDWIGRIYTVITMRKEDFGETEEIRQAKINKQLAMPVYDYFTDELNLVELLAPKLQYIKGTYSYLLYFSPIFQRLSFFYLIKTFVFVYIVYLILNFFNIDFWIQKLIDTLINYNVIK